MGCRSTWPEEDEGLERIANLRRLLDLLTHQVDEIEHPPPLNGLGDSRVTTVAACRLSTLKGLEDAVTAFLCEAGQSTLPSPREVRAWLDWHTENEDKRGQKARDV